MCNLSVGQKAVLQLLGTTLVRTGTETHSDFLQTDYNHTTRETASSHPRDHGKVRRLSASSQRNPNSTHIPMIAGTAGNLHSRSRTIILPFNESSFFIPELRDPATAQTYLGSFRHEHRQYLQGNKGYR